MKAALAGRFVYTVQVGHGIRRPSIVGIPIIINDPPKGVNRRFDGGGVRRIFGTGFLILKEANISGGTWNAAGAVQIRQDGWVRIAGGVMNVAASNLIPSGDRFYLEGGQLNVSGPGPLPWDYMSLYSGTLTIPWQLTDLPDTLGIGDCRLVHGSAPLNLAGVEIAGSGEILVGSVGVNLGTAGDPGSLTGYSADPLTVYGDISGSDALTHVEVYGNLSVGNTAGQMALDDVLLGGGSTIAMEILGTGAAEYDRLLLGPGVDFAGCPIDIDFAGGFTPQMTDLFDLFDATGGADLAVMLGGAAIHVPDNWRLELSTGMLSQVPEPSTLAMLAFGGLTLLWLHRRRK